MITLLAGALVAGLLLPAPARADGFGTTSADFLRLTVGRPNGMAEAGGSVVQDASALYWNPAGMAGATRPDIYVSHDGLPQTLSSDFFGFLFPVSEGPLKGTFGYSLQSLSQGSLDRLDNQGNLTGAFGASDMAHTLGWARTVGDYRAGVSIRYIRQTIDDQSGTSTALDFGAQRDFGAWSAGAAVSNLGPGLAIGSESFPLPLTFRGGASYTAIENELFLASDLSMEKGRGNRLHLGVEYRVYPPWEVYSDKERRMVALRTGYTLGQHDADGPSGFAFGATVEYNRFRVDINYQPFGELGNSAQIAAGWRFD